MPHLRVVARSTRSTEFTSDCIGVNVLKYIFIFIFIFILIIFVADPIPIPKALKLQFDLKKWVPQPLRYISVLYLQNFLYFDIGIYAAAVPV